MIDGLNSLDTSLFLFLNSFHSETLNSLMVFLSGQAIWIPLIIFSVWWAKKRNDNKGLALFILFLLLALIASDVTSSYMFKNIFNRLRPCREPELLPLIYQFGQKCGGKFGFVSSHAANSFALMAYTFKSLGLKSKWWYLVWLLPIVVSYSRVYLGVHYPGDILGGMVVGLSWGLIAAWFFSNSRAQV